MPLTFLPLVLAATTDALVAIRRISNFLRAEELAVPYTIDPSSNVALDVDGDFTWEEVRKGGTATKFDKKSGKDGKGKATKENRKGKDKKITVLSKKQLAAKARKSALKVKKSIYDAEKMTLLDAINVLRVCTEFDHGVSH